MAWVQAARSPKPIGSGRLAGTEILVLSEEVENDQTKTLDFDTDIASRFPDSPCAEVFWIYAEYTATAVGNSRQLYSTILDAVNDDVVAGVGFEQTINAGQSDAFMAAGYLEQNAGLAPDHERLPMGLMILPGTGLFIGELKGTAAPGDDMILHIGLAVYP